MNSTARLSRSEELQQILVKAKAMREQAALLPPGEARVDALRKARQMETAANANAWMGSPGLQSPQ
jgi:hypothetical protein